MIDVALNPILEDEMISALHGGSGHKYHLRGMTGDDGTSSIIPYNSSRSSQRQLHFDCEPTRMTTTTMTKMKATRYTVMEINTKLIIYTRWLLVLLFLCLVAIERETRLRKCNRDAAFGSTQYCLIRQHIR
jgi:hypothetical protein